MLPKVNRFASKLVYTLYILLSQLCKFHKDWTGSLDTPVV